MLEETQGRVERERATYDQGLERVTYNRILGSHAKYQVAQQRLRLSHQALEGKPVDRVLEIGRQMFRTYLDADDVLPDEMYCINISQRELDIGIKESAQGRLRPTFVLMDAHSLDFPDGYFDLVCGLGILHHLDLPVALREIARVLRPGGVFMFSEPLDNNPVGRLVRILTPKARTEDEKPLRYEHLVLIREYFDCEFHYEQALAVPAGVASQMVLKRPDNWLTRGAHQLDGALLRAVPSVGPMFRGVTMIGTPRDWGQGRT